MKVGSKVKYGKETGVIVRAYEAGVGPMFQIDCGEYKGGTKVLMAVQQSDPKLKEA
jgi:hypothetical protein